MSVADARISPLKGVVAVEAMRPGVVAVPASARPRDVASVMAVRGIPVILVKPEGKARAAPHAVVGDLEVVRAALAGHPAEPGTPTGAQASCSPAGAPRTSRWCSSSRVSG